MSNKFIRSLSIYFALLGLLVSIYLLYVYQFSAPLPCTNHGCDLVRYSKYAYIFALPVPLYGVGFYLTVLGVNVLLLRKKSSRLNLLLTLLGWSGFIFSVYLTYLEIYVIKAICSWCVVSAITATMILVIQLIPKKENI
ncbi:MAG: vitamin K epoxide reductase family protein [bacterium]|nr:vitamin K epoxide reductase family protein [bacterium]